MKFGKSAPKPVVSTVAPFAGAWIEMSPQLSSIFYRPVAPFAGAWIEIKKVQDFSDKTGVAPFAGAWIEMSAMHCKFHVLLSRSLRGSVD